MGKRKYHDPKVPRNDDELETALWYAYLEARKHKRRTADEHKFELNDGENVRLLATAIRLRKYIVGRSKAFITHNPVLREIFAALFRDRVVHHLVYACIAPWWNKMFIADSYSCREGKGTDYAIRRLRKFMNKVSEGGTKKTYVAHFDLRGYFVNIPRDKLYEQVLWGLDQQFKNRDKDETERYQYNLLRYLCGQIVFDDPVDGVRMAGSKKKWRFLPKLKSLLYQLPGVGIVIGNLTSQLFSNIYLDQLDRFLKYDMGFKYYGRYVDDGFIVVTEDELPRLLFIFENIVPEFLDCLGLELHPKKFSIEPVDKGVHFLGKFVHLDHVQLGKRAKDRIYRAIQKRGMDLVGDETIISYLGMTKHYRAKKFMKKMFATVGWEYDDF